MKGTVKGNYDQKRKYKVAIPSDVLQRIEHYREKYEIYLKIHNNTAKRNVWMMYDHIAEDLF